MRDFWKRTFFASGDLGYRHCAHCLFVSGSHWKHQPSSAQVTVFRKAGSLSAVFTLIARIRSPERFLITQIVGHTLRTDVSY